MFTFETMLSANQRAQIANTNRELARLYGLTDRWLAAWLLDTARFLRRRNPERLGDPNSVVYEPNFLWQLLPEIAKRLGATRLDPNEATRYASLSHAGLRELAGVYLANVSEYQLGHEYDRDATHPDPAELVTHEIVHGNPVAFAIDRLCPPAERTPDRPDYIAARLREVTARRGHGIHEAWHPALSARATA